MVGDNLTPAERERNRRNAILLEAANIGDLPRVRALVKEGVDINYAEPGTGLTALHIAAGRNAVAVVRFLVGTNRCDYQIKDAQGRTAATVAVTAGRNPAVGRYLFDLQHGIKIRAARSKDRPAEQTGLE